MMAILSLIFFGVLLALATGVIWAVWSLLATFFAKRKLRAILVGLPVSIVLVVATILVLFAALNTPASIFEREFGFAPPPDVAFVNSYNFALGDSGSAYLQFNASPPTITKIVQSSSLSAGNPNFSTNTRPDWFKPPFNTGQVYSRQTNNNANGGFASEMRILVIDPATGEVWYEFSGVD